MDLQAILDAPSSDSSVTHDDDDVGDVVAAAQSDDNVFSQSTVSNLSNATDEVVAVAAMADNCIGTTGRFRGETISNNDQRESHTDVLHSIMNGASGIRDEFDEDGRGEEQEDEQFDSDIVERILMRKYSEGRGGGMQNLSLSGASASGNAGGRGGRREVGNNTISSSSAISTFTNLELERILMEADADCDDDDENDDGADIFHHNRDKFDNSRYGKGLTFASSLTSSPYRNGRPSKAGINGNGKSEVASANNENMDFLLQSILNEDNDDSDEDTDDDDSDYYNASSFPAAANDRSRRRFTEVGNNKNNEKQKNHVISSLHSMEVDAILNSVQDDDDNDEDDDLYLRSFDISSLSKKRDLQDDNGYRGFAPTISSHCRQPNDSDDSDSATDTNDDLSNYGKSSGFQQQQRSRMEDVMTHDKNNISIVQYPLTRKGEGGSLDIKQQQVQVPDSKAPHIRIGRQREQRDIDHNKSTAKEIRLPQNIQQREAPVNNDDDDDDERACALSALRLQQAENAERKLLSSSSSSDAPTTRNLVSPLTVKRRMRPRVELMTKVRTSSSAAVEQEIYSSYQRQRSHSNQNQSNQQQQQPRFCFSGGIIQMKSMISSLGRRGLSSQLLNGENIADNRCAGQTSSLSSAAAIANNMGTSGGAGRLPTALAVNSKFIAIGNQGGEVLVFDLYEQLKIVLGKTQQKQHGTTAEGIGGGGSVRRNDVTTAASHVATSHFGSVTSIDLSSHGDYLLAGYGTGNIILWDVIKGAILKHIADLHTSSICSARFTFVSMSGVGYGAVGDGEKLGAVSIDAGGLVNKLIFSQGRLVWSSSYSVETECLLDGTAGQILAMDVLDPLDMTAAAGAPTAIQGSAHQQKTTFDSRIVLVALSSGRSSFAVSVEPKVSVLHRWARPSTERIDPSRGDDDRLTQASSNYASTYVSSYTNASYASSYMSTSTYQSNASTAMERQFVQSKSSIDSMPVPFLPCLSWGWALVSGGGHSVTPILARAWGCCLQFLRASPPLDVDHDYAPDNVPTIEGNSAALINWPAFGTHDEFDASAPVVALNWLGKRSLAYLTITNEFILIDTVIMTMQERLDFSQIKLVYAEFALSRSASTSRLNQQSSHGCCTTFMNCFRLSDNRLYIMCQGEVKEITVLGIRQQIMSLEDGGQWLEALALALDHYESSILSQEDNKRNSDPSSLVLKNFDVMTRVDPSLLTDDEVWMAELLMRYLILAVDNAPDSPQLVPSSSNNKIMNRLNLAESHFEMLSGVCLEFCTVIRRLDLLFGPIFRCFYEARYMNVFFDVTKSYILNDKLKYIAPEVMVLFVAHCKEMGDLPMVERCLLHIDCHLMDFDSILTLLKKHKLYTGLLHVYSTGLDDYVSPLEIVFDAVFDSAGKAEVMHSDRQKDAILSNTFEQYGYKAMLYLRYSFMGRTFPKGNLILPEERRRSLLPELFCLLYREKYKSPQGMPSHQSQSKNEFLHGIRALSYPYLRTLILVDTKAFLECLALIFDDPGAKFAQAQSQVATGSWVVDCDVNNTMKGSSPSEDAENGKEILPDRQELVSILASIIMADSVMKSSYHFGVTKQMTQLTTRAEPYFLDFLAKYLRLGVFTVPKEITLRVFIRLCNKKDATEEDILTLLRALPGSSYELEKVLASVESVNMTRAALFLHKVAMTSVRNRYDMSELCKAHFNRSIDCYLEDKDEDFKSGVFPYVKKECSGDNVSTLRDVVVHRLPELVELDSVLTAQLVGEIFVEDFDMILSSLRGIEGGRIEYEFLRAIICGALDKVDRVAAQELSANLTVDHHHVYLHSMTRFQPDEVYQYLSNNNDYRLSDALKICRDGKITDASAYLLERTGDVSGALNLMLETLDSRTTHLRSILQSSYSSLSSDLKRTGRIGSKSCGGRHELAEKDISAMKQLLSAILDLCERNKDDHLALDNERGPLLWFYVLDRLVNAKTLLCNSKDSAEDISSELSTVLGELLLMTMQRLIPNVSIYELMHKVTRDHAGRNLGDFREMLVGMLKTYRSELIVCSSAVDVMYSDIRLMSCEKKHVKVRGSLVLDCPQCREECSHYAIIDVSSSGNVEVRSPRSVQTMSLSTRNEQASVDKTVSWLQHRRRTERQQTRRILRSGKVLNMRTASEYQFAPKRVDEQVIFRQVGSILEAQHVGGL